MLDLFFGYPQVWFGVPALVGTVFFLLRMVLMGVGGDGGLDIDDASHGGHGGFEAHGDASDGFKYFSIQAAGAFAMGFGWGGLGAFKGSGLSVPGALLVAIACGIGMTWLLALLLRAVHSMQSSGNTDIRSAIGQRGTVEVLVPGTGKGQGRVGLVLAGSQRSFYAVTQGEDLPTNTPVVVVAINDDHSLTVVPS